MAEKKKTSKPAAEPISARQAVVDTGFMPARAKLIDVAAFFDRIERHGVADDFRCVALREASAALADGKPERARRILEHLSDPTTEPDAVSTGKAAAGAYRKPEGARPAARGRQ